MSCCYGASLSWITCPVISWHSINARQFLRHDLKVLEPRRWLTSCWPKPTIGWKKDLFRFVKETKTTLKMITTRLSESLTKFKNSIMEIDHRLRIGKSNAKRVTSLRAESKHSTAILSFIIFIAITRQVARAFYAFLFTLDKNTLW